jgi:hypothetical protein
VISETYINTSGLFEASIRPAGPDVRLTGFWATKRGTLV